MFRARAAWRTWSLRERGAPVTGVEAARRVEAARSGPPQLPDNCNYPAVEMGLQQTHPKAGRTLLARLFGGPEVHSTMRDKCTYRAW